MSRDKFRSLLPLASVLLFCVSALSPLATAEAQENNLVLRGYTGASNQVETIDQNILKIEIDLLKLNAEFRSHYMASSKSKKRRLHLYDAAGGGIANAGDIALLSQFWRYWKHPGEGLKHKGRLQSGPIVVMVAYLTLGSLYLGDGVYDLISDYRSKRKGFDAKSIYKRALSIKSELDKLFSERAEAVRRASIPAEQLAVLAAQDNVLKDMKDLALVEFSQLYVDARKKRVARDLTTLGTVAVCATGAFPGALSVIRGIKDVNLKTVGGGGIGFLISGSTLTAAPALIHGGAAIAGKISAEKLEKALCNAQSKQIATLETDLKQLNDACINLSSGTSATAQTKSNINEYRLASKLLKDREAYLRQNQQRQKREIIESFISYAAKGGPQIAFGTMLTRAGYKYKSDPVRAFRAVAQGATVNEVSWGNWMLDDFQKGMRDEIYNHKQSKISSGEQPFSVSNTELVNLQTFAKLLTPQDSHSSGGTSSGEIEK